MATWTRLEKGRSYLWKKGDNLRVDDKDEALAALHHLVHSAGGGVGHVPEDGEHHARAEDAGGSEVKSEGKGSYLVRALQRAMRTASLMQLWVNLL